MREDGGVDQYRTAPGWIAHIASDHSPAPRRPPLVQVHESHVRAAQTASFESIPEVTSWHRGFFGKGRKQMLDPAIGTASCDKIVSGGGDSSLRRVISRFVKSGLQWSRPRCGWKISQARVAG